MTPKKRKKSGSSRTAWMVLVVLFGLGAAGTWYIWDHGGQARF